MVPISSYYIDKEPPNQSSVRSLLSKQDARQSVSQATEPEAAPATAAAVPAAASDNAALAREDKEQPVPPPAEKDDDKEAPAVARSQEVEEDEQPASPLGEAKELSETGAAADETVVDRGQEETNGGDKLPDGGSMEDVSLGGAMAGKKEGGDVDDDEGEEVDLS